MKKILYLFIFFLLSHNILYAQDSRQRTVETVVMDVLAQLPSTDKDKFNQSMSDLAINGEKAIVILGNMLGPAEKGVNSRIEYAISGLVSYITAEGNAKYIPQVRVGLRKAIETCNFNYGKSFLMSQLQVCADESDIEVFSKYLLNKELSSMAINAIINTPNSEKYILDMLKKRNVDPLLLAYAVREKSITEAEPFLLSWLEYMNNDEDKNMVYSALGACGTEKSLKILAENSVNDYMTLLERLSSDIRNKKVMSAARKMLKHDDSHIRTAAMRIIVSMKKNDIDKELFSVLKDNDRQYRNSVLKAVAPYMTEELYTEIAHKFNSFDTEVKIDYINFIGNNKVASQKGLLMEAAKNKETAGPSIIALGKVGGKEVFDFLLSLLGGENNKEVTIAILSLKYDVANGLVDILDGNDEKSIVSALEIISEKRIKKASDKVFSLLTSNNENIKNAAYKALEGVVNVDDIKYISDMVNKTDEKYINSLQNAFLSSVKYLSKEDCVETVLQLMNDSEKKSFYYPALAYSGTVKASEILISEYNSGKNKEVALNEILKMKTPSVIDFLSEIIKSGENNSVEIIANYVNLVKLSRLAYSEKCSRYEDILKINSSDEVKLNVLTALSFIPTEQAFKIAANFMNDVKMSYRAAVSVKNIASNRLSAIDYVILEPTLNKAKEIFSKTGNADDGYAVDEINKLLNELKPFDPYVLTDEEKKQGFELLFDGTDLSKWEGDTLGYKAINGAIMVSADYGNSHNLYTKKQYGDFIFRFDFCFKTPGVNNGVGIRTPKNVDAAYDAMCEVQILDHDFPAYKNIAKYQVHGSVYGVIPAKRITHKPLGEWSTEEIKVIGDRITVTLNGEVILDGDVREACKGHNVAPDGGKKNPYTVDGKNHPGLFNKKGHISFCGHGAGIMLRNVRILNLDKNEK